MAGIKKNVNFLLILLFLAVVTSMVGFTIYYQTSYKNLTSEYNQKVTELTLAQQNLSSQKENLKSTRTELELRVADKTKFENLYQELVTEKNKLDKDLSLTRGALASTQAQLSETLANLQKANSDLTNALKDLSSSKTLAAAYLKQKDNLCIQLKTYNSTVTC
ncbi:MAG: hypothetical protein AABX51_06255 [Nanoarchaeota archaeon]